MNAHTLHVGWDERTRACVHALSYATRSLRRTPQLTIPCVVCIALGIGVNAVALSLTYSLIVREPSRVTAPGRVARMYLSSPGEGDRFFSSASASYPQYQVLRAGTAMFTQMAAYHVENVSVGVGAYARQAYAAFASDTYFETLGLKPTLGRFFDRQDDAPGSPTVAVISYAAWNRDFGAARTVLGHTVKLNGVPSEIIGVAPRSFVGVDPNDLDVWVPLGKIDVLGPGDGWLSSPFASWLTIIGRLRTGASRSAAGKYLTRLLRTNSSQVAPVISLGALNGAGAPELAEQRRLLGWVVCAALAVLAIACANVSLLLLARGAERQHELGVRLALGATRAQLARTVLLEHFILGAVGAGAGVGALILASGAARFLGFESTPMRPAMAVCLLLGCLTAGAALGFGLAPALKAAQTSAMTAVATGPSWVGRSESTKGRALLSLQLALSFALISVTISLGRAVSHVAQIDVGADARRLLIVSSPARGDGFPPSVAWRDFSVMRRQVEGLPGVASASLATEVPFVSIAMTTVQSSPHASSSDVSMAIRNSVEPGYLATIGASVLRGRSFTWADTAMSVHVAIVSSNAARRLWPNQDAIGKCLYINGKSSGCVTVIGVTSDAKYGDIYADPQPIYYLPAHAVEPEMPSLLIRTSGDASLLIHAIRRTVAEQDPDVPYMDIKPMTSVLSSQFDALRRSSILLGCTGALAFSLSIFGLYGLLTHWVRRRGAEIGLRKALGANACDTIRMVFVSTANLIGVGVGIGIVLAVAVQRVIEASTRFASSGLMTYLAIAAGLSLGAALAAGVPALVAARLSPMSAMRQTR